MPDNISVTSGTGVTIAADDDGSALHQWVKIQIGGDGSFVPITTANGLPVQVLSLPAITVASATVTNLGTFAVQVTSLPPFAVGAITSVSNGTIVSVTNLLSTLSTVTNAGTFAVQITSLPSFAVGAITSVSNGTIVSVTNLLSVLSTVTNAGTFSVQITSLPSFAVGAITSVSNGTIVSVTNLLSTLSTVTNAGTFAVQITSLPSFAVGAITSVSNGTIVSVTNLVPTLASDNAYRFVVGQAAPITGYWRFTSTYTSAQTNVVLVALPASTTALHLTDCIFSCAQTHGSFTLLESPSNGAVRTALDRVYFRDYGGAVLNLSRPLVLDTNSALIMTSRSATDQSVTVIGYAL